MFSICILAPPEVRWRTAVGLIGSNGSLPETAVLEKSTFKDDLNFHSSDTILSSPPHDKSQRPPERSKSEPLTGVGFSRRR